MAATIDKFQYATDLAAQNAWQPELDDLISYALDSDYAASNNCNVRMVLPAGSISISGCLVRVILQGHATAAQAISGAAIGERSGSTGNFASAPTRLTFNGSNSGIIPAGGTLTSDLVYVEIDETKDYLVHMYLDSGAGTVSLKYVPSGATTRYVKLDSGVDNTLTEDISGLSYGNDGVPTTLLIVEIASALVPYSESTIKYEGSYALKMVAEATSSINKTVTRTVSPTINLTDQDNIRFWIRASRTGSNFKIGFHDSGGTTTEVTPNIAVADTWQEITLDISAIANANKDAIDSIILTILNADAENTIYLDAMMSYSDGEFSQADIDAAEAAQLATDQAAVNAAKASIKDDTTILGVTGLLDLDLYLLKSLLPDKKYLYFNIDRGDGQTGTLHASNIHTNAGAPGVDLSAAILKKDEVVDDVRGTLEEGGSGDYPDPANVLDTDTTNGVAGTYHPPTVAEVQEGVAFGPASALTGTYGTDATGDGSMFGDALTAILNSDLGKSASYTPTGGAAVSIRVLFHRDYAPELGIEGHHIWIEARTSDVSAAVPGEAITVNGVTYEIKSPPQKEDDQMSIIELSED